MDIRRFGAAGALVAAAAWTASAIVALVSPGANFGPVGSQSWYVIESSDAIAEAGMLLALGGIHARQAADYGRLGLAGFIVGFAGTASVLASTVLWVLAAGAESPLIDLLFSAGGLAVVIGFPVLGGAIVRKPELPRWSGWLLLAWIVYFPAIFFALDYYGEARVLFGLVWLAIAWALWSRREGDPGRP